MTQLLSSQLSKNLYLNSPSNTVGTVLYMTVDQANRHENSSSESSVSTLQTFIEELALEQKMKKQKKIVKNSPKKNAPANWSKKQIAELVQLLKRYGSDFTMIATKITKTRDQIKRKFKVLQKKCPNLADAIFQRDTSAELQAMMNQNDFLQEC